MPLSLKNKFFILIFSIFPLFVLAQDSTRIFYAWPMVELGSENVVYRYPKGDSLFMENGNFKVMSNLDKSICLFTGSFKSFKKEGTWTYYDDGIKISSMQNYKNDLLDGICSAYDEDGKLIAEVNYSGGEMHGEFFWEDFMTGLGFTYGQFDHGVPSGVWKYKNGTELIQEVNYAYGPENQIISFYKNGKMYKRETYKNRELINTEEW